MPLADILEAIRGEADDEIATITAEAEWEAAAIAEAARAESARAEAEATGAHDRELAASSARLLREARREAARAVWEAREEVYQHLREEVGRRLAALRHDGAYAAALAGLLEECRAELPDATVVRCDERDRRLVTRLLDGSGSGAGVVADPCLTTGGGIQVATADGRTADDTFEARLARAEPHLRRFLAVSCPGVAGEGVLVA